jgi:hypothetical protein
MSGRGRHPRSAWNRSQVGCLLGSLLCYAACAHLHETGGSNAVGVHLSRASYDPVTSTTPSREVGLGDAYGVRASYSRRIAGGLKLWFGPEVLAAWLGESGLSTTSTSYPAAVSRSFAAALVRANFFAVANDPPGRWLDDLFQRVGLGVGVCLAYGRFAESQLLVDGSPNTSRRTDNVFGPTIAFSPDLRLTKNVILRADTYFLFLKPELSFPWPDRTADKVIAGGGLVVVF